MENVTRNLDQVEREGGRADTIRAGAEAGRMTVSSSMDGSLSLDLSPKAPLVDLAWCRNTMYSRLGRGKCILDADQLAGFPHRLLMSQSICSQDASRWTSSVFLAAMFAHMRPGPEASFRADPLCDN